MKELTRNLLEELVRKFVDLQGNMTFCTGFVNNKGHYVTLSERTDYMGIDYAIRNTMLDSEYGNELELYGGGIILQLEDNYEYAEEEFLDVHKSDYKNYLKNKEAYIQYKVDYILALTWE